MRVGLGGRVPARRGADCARRPDRPRSVGPAGPFATPTPAPSPTARWPAGGWRTTPAKAPLCRRRPGAHLGNLGEQVWGVSRERRRRLERAPPPEATDPYRPRANRVRGVAIAAQRSRGCSLSRPRPLAAVAPPAPPPPGGRAPQECSDDARTRAPDSTPPERPQRMITAPPQTAEIPLRSRDSAWGRWESNPHGGCPPAVFETAASAVPPRPPGRV
jgi:hypothetical protein